MAQIQLTNRVGVVEKRDLTLYDGLSNINKMTIPSPGYIYTDSGGGNYHTIVLPTINEYNISIAIYSGSNCGYNLRSLEKINFSNYKYLQIEMNSIRNTSQRDGYLGAVVTELESGLLSEIAPITSQPIFWEQISTTKQTYTYDISNITGKKYLVWGTAGGQRLGTLYKIKLIHK